MNIINLSDDLIISILLYLPKIDFNNLIFLNKKFNELRFHPIIFTKLSLSITNFISKNEKLKYLQILYIEKTKTYENTNMFFELLKNLPYLVRLTLDNFNIDYENLLSLNNLKKLKLLEILKSSLKPNSFQNVILNELEILNLEYIDKIYNNFSYLKNFTKLIDLKIELINNNEVHGQFNFLNELTNLKSLSIDAKIKDSDLINLDKLINLKYLYLPYCNNITDIGLNYISNLTNLKILNLSYCNITINGLSKLHKLKLLKLLFINKSICEHNKNEILRIMNNDKLLLHHYHCS